MRAIRFVLAALVLSALSACYTSKTDLVGDDAVAAHAKLTFIGHEADAKPLVFTREGNGYFTEGDGQRIDLRLKPVEGDYYVAQLSGPGDDGNPEYLYGYLRLDQAAGKADLWLSVGSEGDVRPGLSLCDDTICIDDINAYIAYGKEKVAMGETPDTTFDVTFE